MVLFFVQSDAVVPENQHRSLGIVARQLDMCLSLVLRLQIAPCQDCVRSVLQQLANKDLRAAVGVHGQQIDYAAEVDLKSVFHVRFVYVYYLYLKANLRSKNSQTGRSRLIRNSSRPR